MWENSLIQDVSVWEGSMTNVFNSYLYEIVPHKRIYVCLLLIRHIYRYIIAEPWLVFLRRRCLTTWMILMKLDTIAFFFFLSDQIMLFFFVCLFATHINSQLMLRRRKKSPENYFSLFIGWSNILSESYKTFSILCCVKLTFPASAAT